MTDEEIVQNFPSGNSRKACIVVEDSDDQSEEQTVILVGQA